MGEAKRRGSYEERVSSGIEKKRIQEKENQRILEEKKHKEKELKRLDADKFDKACKMIADNYDKFINSEFVSDDEDIVVERFTNTIVTIKLLSLNKSKQFSIKVNDSDGELEPFIFEEIYSRNTINKNALIAASVGLGCLIL